MRSSSRIILLAALVATAGIIPPPALAGSSGYCLECHPSRTLQPAKIPAASWERSVYQNRLNPCPGIRTLSEENFFTESRMVKVDEILKTLEREGWATDLLRKNTSQAAGSFSALRQGPVISFNHFSRESWGLRSIVHKVYGETLRDRAEESQRWLIGVGVLLFIGVLVLLGIGLQKLSRMRKAILLFFLLAGSTSFTACSSGPADTAKKNPAQEQLEQSLSVAARVSSNIDEGYYSSIILAQMAREWSLIDRAGSGRAFELAWKTALENREEASLLRSFQELLSRWPDRAEASRKKVNFDTVLDLRDEIREADGRTWALRAIAEEWVQADEKKGKAALESACQKTLEIKDPAVRDRDLKSVAEAWAGVDGNRAWEISRSIADPFLRPMAQANLALTVRRQDKSGNWVREAWKTAESLPSSYPQFKAFARISAAGAKISPREKKFWADKVTGQVQRIENPELRSAALQEVIYEWAPVDGEQAERWLEAISPEFSEGRAYSYLLLSRSPGIPPAEAVALLRKALAEADRVDDPFESQRIKNLAGIALAKSGSSEAWRLIPRIGDPFYRSEILGELAEGLSLQDREKALAIAERIPLEPLRNRALLRVAGRGMVSDRQKVYSFYREAFQAVQVVPDPYVRALGLIELGKDWGRMEKGRETALFESALRAAGEIPSVSSQAEILEALAAAWKDIDPGKGQAILKKIDPAVIRARKSLEEIGLWTNTDPARVQQWAETIPPSLSYEKARALREAVISLKKTQPKAAMEILEEWLRQDLDLPDGVPRSKLLSEWVVEAVSLDKEGALRRINRLSDQRMRNTLTREAGGIWAREDPLYALRAAGEISESSLRQTLYEKIADGAAQSLGQSKAPEAQPSLLSGLASWGRGREKARKEELRAIPFFEKALAAMDTIREPRQKSYLLSALAVEWAPLEEKKALEVAGKIPAAFSEPLSYALLRIGAQYGKWNRKEAGSVFHQALLAAERIWDAPLRAQRLLQLAQEWKGVDPARTKEVLAKAEREAGRVPSPGARETILAQILKVRTAWEPENSLAISRSAESASLQAGILLEGAKILQGRSLEGDRKILERVLQSAQKGKNLRLMGEAALAWYPLDPQKGLEILDLIDEREIRVQTLLQMARASVSRPQEEAKRLLHRATEEALAVDGLTLKTRLLKEIGHNWAGIDKEEARATYRKTYEIFDQEYLTSPQLR
jgi:hypothetical protein